MKNLLKYYENLSLRAKFTAISYCILVVLLFITLLISLSGCGVVKGHSNWLIDKGIKTVDSLYVPDNAVEENLEDAIESITGLEIDLSPNIGPEK